MMPDLWSLYYNSCFLFGECDIYISLSFESFNSTLQKQICSSSVFLCCFPAQISQHYQIKIDLLEKHDIRSQIYQISASGFIKILIVLSKNSQKQDFISAALINVLIQEFCTGNNPKILRNNVIFVCFFFFFEV